MTRVNVSLSLILLLEPGLPALAKGSQVGIFLHHHLDCPFAPSYIGLPFFFFLNGKKGIALSQKNLALSPSQDILSRLVSLSSDPPIFSK